MKRSLLCMAALLVAASAHAKLPAPPAPTDEAKAKAAETAAKTAWAAKVDGYKLCLSMDKAASNHFKTAAATGKPVKPAAANAPACADPGPFTYVAAAPKPVEAAGAHSPAATASSPPSGKAPAAAPTPKKP
ncbi:hypothetical protein [Hydrogenophaga sp.]|jgi:hypothetical protein|uniref:hypothetical protein n=1 Tax=Hydrogenophaga sp. TaxID=1904254 RepID=UPI003F6E57CD